MAFFLVLCNCVALLSVTPLLSANAITYIIKPRPETPCPVLPQSGPCLTLSEYADQEEFSPNTTLEFLMGIHNLHHNLTIVNSISFTMLGGSFSSQGDPVTAITCRGPATLSFHDSREVSLQAIEFVHCGDLHQPAIMVSSVQYFEIIECSVRESISAGLLANQSSLFIHNVTSYKNSGTGLIMKNCVTEFAGNTTFAENGNVSFSVNSTCSPDKSLNCGGGLAAINSSVQFNGISTFSNNVANNGGAIYVEACVLIFQGCQIFEENTAVRGGGMYVLVSNVRFQGPSLRFVLICTVFKNLTTVIDDAVFRGNTASDVGGGLMIQNSTLSSYSSLHLVENTAKRSAGGLSALYSRLEFTRRVTANDNTAGWGGGMAFQGTISIFGNAAVFNNNSANIAGGGIGAYLESLVVFEGHLLFIGNSALFGGGVTAQDCSLYCHDSAIFSTNSAFQGGAVYVVNTDLVCNGSTDIIGNSAQTHGGGIRALNSVIHLSDFTTLTSNNAGIHGGGISIWNTDFNCSGSSQFDANIAKEYGGGFDVDGNSIVSFSGNVDLVNNTALYGGGMDIWANCTLICIDSVNFINNTAVGGGGIAGYKSTILFQSSSTFIGNSADTSGGGMALLYCDMELKGTTVFTGNYVLKEGGGIHVQESLLRFGNMVILRENSARKHGGGMKAINTEMDFGGPVLFDSNAVNKIGGGAFIVNDPLIGPGATVSQYTFRKSVTFFNNAAQLGGGTAIFSGRLEFEGQVSFTNNTAGHYGATPGFGGGVYCYNSSLNFTKKSEFTLNGALDGGGLYFGETTIIVKGSSSIVSNYALANGGGLHLAGQSELWLHDNSSIVISQNYATQFGGAIYIRDDPFLYCINQVLTSGYQAHCLFQSTNWPTTATIHILHDNFAGEAGSAIYGGLLTDCGIIARNDSSYNDSRDTVGNVEWIFPNLSNNQVNESSIISSDPFQACLCISNESHCYLPQHNVTAFPGSTIRIPVVAVGQLNGTVPSVISARFITSEDRVAVSSYQNVQLTNKTCTMLEYNVLSKTEFNTSENYTMALFPDSPCQSHLAVLPVEIQLLPCPSGFVLSRSLYKSCICNKRVQQYTNTCDIDAQTILNHGQYWIGWDTTSNGAILHPHCPFDYCRSGNTSFTVNDTDRQCQHNRAGLLCGGCKEGFSLALGSSECLKCSTYSYLSLILVLALAGVVLVVFLLALKLTVALGTINGLIFYANIVAANQATFFPQHNSEGDFLRIFIAWINLDLGIEICFYRGMNMYAWTWLQFIFPFYIWTLVGIVIILCHYYTWATRIFGRNPVAALATLFLLSYTKLLRTIITAMSFTYLDFPDNPRVAVWLYDGNVQYLSGKHIALFTAALLLFTFLFLPYTLVIFLRQWIEARSKQKVFSWISNFRIKPFLDAYHGPLRSSHRYWPGLLLIARALLLLVFAFNAFGDPNINLLAIVTCTVGLLTLLVLVWSVYKSTYLYILEVSFLVNTLILAASSAALERSITNQLYLTYTSVGIAFATFIGILIYHTLVQVRDSRIWRDAIKPRLQCSQRIQLQEAPADLGEASVDDKTTDQRPRAAVTTTYVNLRELLLEDEQN